jgi:hypothetical protein
MESTVTNHDQQTSSGVKPFGRKGDNPAFCCILFDRKLSLHAVNLISGIVSEINNAT